MPRATTYLDPNNKERTGMEMMTGTEREARVTAYTKAYKYYTAEHPRQLDRKPGEPDDNAVINMLRQTVDRTATFLFPTMPDFELDPNTTEESKDERWLTNVWAANGGISLLQEIALNGCLSGHVYVRIRQADPTLGDEYPQIILLDPGSIITYWQADDIRRVVWHEQRWSVGRDEFILDIVNRGAYWELLQYQRGGSSGWTLQTSERWNWPYGPIVHWKHLPNPNQFYGLSEAINVDLNDKVNLITSENNRIIRYHSSPKTIGTGASSGEIQRAGTDELWTVENPDAKFYNLEMQSDLAAARQHEEFLYRNYLAEQRVVILNGDIKDFQRVTNAGVRTVFMDMLSKNSILRWNYGTGLREISRRLFILKTGQTDILPVINHADPLPVDETERANVAVMHRSMNIASRETISTKSGYNWPDELRKQINEGQITLFQPVQANDQADKPVGSKPEDNSGGDENNKKNNR